MIEYNKSNIPLAKMLRKNMTYHERKLWYEFLREYTLRFQRQKAIDNYIGDFYCAKAGLVLELDGNQHFETDEAVQKDALRTKCLNNKGLEIVRISNIDIDKNFKGVCDFIDLKVKERVL